jgi:hypothetical protein
MNFDDATAYFRAYEKDPAACAIFTMQMLADLKGVSRAAIVRMIDTGQLKQIKIGKTRYVRASSYIELLSEYDRRVKRVREYLEQIAAKRQTVTYEPVMSLIGLRWQTPADRTTIGGILGTISEQTSAETKDALLLSVLVHRKTSGITRPGQGFFALASYLGYEWEDENAFVKDQTQKVWDFYASRVLTPA